MASARDHEHMARALRLAARPLRNTDPNPRVGCVIVKDDRVVGEGFHARAGGPHAERVALDAAGEAARGATAYVTLEPCCHQGRTPPCAPALIEAGIARVVCGAVDPNPRVNGGGLSVLAAAGIAVESGVLAAESEALNRGFFSRMRRGRPWVRSKLAASLDGRTALADGRSQWITGAAARADVHRWRARSSAVLTGSGTVLADDPLLTARPEDAPADLLQPLRVIVDSDLQTPRTARTLSAGGEVVIFTTRDGGGNADALVAAGARIERVSGVGRCDLREVIERLGALEVNEVWVEAGPRLNGALLDARLVDELVLYFAPKVLGDGARGMFALGPLASLDAAPALEIDDVRRVGDDLRVIARPRC
ncbi:MAG TPA: bifunctional diaminohydroxyphosphoribosylaminopyrimidine deaminase/5-amino-6-(5-phosphoribosylamino)uracil reductase RibD [Gammaproteobacteria bacterium]